MFLASLKSANAERYQVEILESQEVNFLLDKFIALYKLHKQSGYLTLQQLLEIFMSWKEKNSALNEKLKELKSDRGAGYAINSVEFLLIMLEIKEAVCANSYGLISLDSGGKEDLNSTMKEFNGKTRVSFADFMKRILFRP
ncbi:uncharacterized protein LOC126845980 [Adelges cooleyi]|uniref:uncharacterized protein LOC126845980 n=1 Tax=Adelges cooleyi TaxID=133065 RepID=UPI0021801B44|nr:uncharacterized protein LOC126845980 [Adelges cooleyi]